MGLTRMTIFIGKLLRTLLVAGVFALATTALMRGTGPGITFALEEDFNLTIDSAAFFRGLPVPGSTWELKDLVPGVDKFFDLAGVLPGDSGNATISMHVESRQSGAWMCLDFPAAPAGSLAEGTQFFAWRDDGDNVFEPGEAPLFGPAPASDALHEKTYAIADTLTGDPVGTNETRHVGLHWCAGELSVNLATGEMACIGETLGNEAQGDSFSIDVSIRALLERGREGFTCSGEVIDDGRTRPARPDLERPERPVFERPPRPER